MKQNFLIRKSAVTLKNCIVVMVFLLCSTSLLAQLRVGDAGVKFDASKYDSRYPQMKEWQKAGVQGGIPLRATVAVKKTINPTNSSGINSAINDVSKQGGGILKLNNGKYTINSSVKMKSNVRVVGESKDGVRLVITMGKGDGIDFGRVSKSGLENLTVEGGFGVPNDFEMTEAKKSFFSVSVKMDGGAKNNWIDNCNILNSGRHPLIVAGDYNTVRDCFISRCWNKSSGYQGYVHIKGAHNLVTTTECVYIRHFSMQDSSSEYNVIYGNYTQQEINFHNDDNGNNLVEKNTIRLHKGLKDIWTALMGPWASFHNVSRNDNYLFNNDCIEHNRGNKKPFGGTDKVFVGPNRKQSSERGAEYPFDTTNKVPKGGTFYPIILDGTTPPTPTPPTSVAVTGVSLSGGSGILQIGEKTTFTAKVLPNNASNKSVTWSSNNNNVASVNANGVVTAKANGSATITVKTVDGNKTASSNITVKETTIPTPPTPPTGGCNLPKTLNDVVINKQTVNTSFGTSISCAASVTISMTIEGIGPMENADYLNIYYKVDGGAPIAISENRDAFSSKTISASGIKGNLVEIVVDGFTSFRDETYTVSNILISADGGTTTPTPDTGGQNDASIKFTKPSNNQTFNTGDDVVVNVTTANNKNVAKIEMYLNGAFVRQELYDSYDWGHTSKLDPVLKNMKAGTYTLKAVVTDKAGKITENAIKIVVGAGKKNSTIAEDAFLMIAPNPVTGANLNITQKGVENLQIVNMLGVVVKNVVVTNEKIAVDVSELATGVYVLRAINKDFTSISKQFIVK